MRATNPQGPFGGVAWSVTGSLGAVGRPTVQAVC